MKRGQQGAFTFGAGVRSSYVRAKDRHAKMKGGGSILGFTLLACVLLLVVCMYRVHLVTKNRIKTELNLAQSESLRGLPLEQQQQHTTETSAAVASVRQHRLRAESVVGSTPVSGVTSLEAIQEKLRNSPYHAYMQSYNDRDKPGPSLEDVLVYLHEHPACRDKPIFSTMANVGSDLYWQLIENFVYTMAKYGLTDCTLMICVSDPYCMELCRSSYFPCFNYQHQTIEAMEEPGNKKNKRGANPGRKVHTMEQIAQLKLYTMPKALLRGVDIFMLDLDVGFLDDPMKLVSKFYQSDQQFDAFVQEDVVFIMNRSVAGWKQWWTEPMPNIGLFLVRGNQKASAMFNLAWNDYSVNTPKNIRMNPGKDQNKVVQAMRTSRWRTGFKWGYIPNNTAVLIDKVFKFEDMAVELGGLASNDILGGRGAVAVHTTCYEQKAKIMGLKAANAFWNPKYYNPSRRTLTKKMIFTTPRTVLQEIRTLIYLALRTNRTLIIPNMLAATVSDPSLLRAQDKRSNKVQRPVFLNQTLWPGFRVLYLKTKGGQKNGESILRVEVVEPGFYWRVRNDYISATSTSTSSSSFPASSTTPEPHIISFPEAVTVRQLESTLASPMHDSFPRVVLHVHAPPSGVSLSSPSILQDMASLVAHQVAWAEDSVGKFFDFNDEVLIDRKLPELDVAEFEPEKEDSQRILAADVIRHTRLCANILDRMRGNRSCFDKCS